MGCDSQTHNHIKNQQCRVHDRCAKSKEEKNIGIRATFGSLLTPGLRRGLFDQLCHFFRLREHGHVCEFSLAFDQMMAETDRSHTEDTKFEDWRPRGCDGGEHKLCDRSVPCVIEGPKKVMEDPALPPYLSTARPNRRCKARPGLRGLQ